MGTGDTDTEIENRERYAGKKQDYISHVTFKSLHMNIFDRVLKSPCMTFIVDELTDIQS